MIELKTPRGLPTRVPETAAEDPSPKFAPDQLGEIAAYYEENGYVVVRGLLPAERCDEMRWLWDEEIKPSQAHIYRQATAKAERHQLNDKGWVMNPILNLQSVDPSRYKRFRRVATDGVLTGDGMASVFRKLLGDTPKIVQSMYFEGNSATWEHQDSYYLDSVNVGSMAAAWIALEDIAPRAGRFFVCPKSHRMLVSQHGLENNIVDNHEAYIASVVAKIVELGMEIRAPRLEKGDVLFWNSLTVHGSLDSSDPRHSRSSITCHAIPARDRFLQFQMIPKDLPTTTVNGVEVYRPKDLASLKNRLVLWVEGSFPGPFYWLKRMAIRAVAAAKGRGPVGSFV
jgi:phytanoyl-CoA hydroxylase